MLFRVEREFCRRAITDAGEEIDFSDDTAHSLGEGPEFFRNFSPSFRPLVRNDGGMNENAPANRCRPLPNLDGFDPSDDESRPRLLD